MVQPLWKTIQRFSKKLKIGLTYNLAVPHLSIHPKGIKAGCERGICISMFIAVLFTITKMWKQPKCPLQMNGYGDIYIKCIKVKVSLAQSCSALCNPMNCSPPGSSVHGILWARRLEWVAIPFSRRSSQPRDQTRVSHIAGGFFTI